MTADVQKSIKGPTSPDHIRKPLAPCENSRYASRNYYLRNVTKTLAPMEYTKTAEEAWAGTGLP
jgi:hypothetical protein